MIGKRLFIGFGLLALTSILAIIYKLYNPLLYNFYPACPIKHVTGFDCPTCGTQRATHLFLNGEFKAAFLQNPLIFVLSPYILFWIYLKLIKNPTDKELKIFNALYGNKALPIVTGIVIIFTIWRNIQ
jgi:hypothetical protein